MPTKTGKDSTGCFARWGSSGKKYRYRCGNDQARKQAITKANKQGAAAHASGFTEEFKKLMEEFLITNNN